MRLSVGLSNDFCRNICLRFVALRSLHMLASGGRHLICLSESLPSIVTSGGTERRQRSMDLNTLPEVTIQEERVRTWNVPKSVSSFSFYIRAALRKQYAIKVILLNTNYISLICYINTTYIFESKISIKSRRWVRKVRRNNFIL
jgi:hypothetical protein